MKRAIALCVSLALVSWRSADCQLIRGTVLEDSTRRPVQDASIWLVGARGDTVGGPVRSDSTGAFVLRAESSGRYVLRAQRIGFTPVTAPNIELVMRDIVELEVLMSAAPTLLEPVRITSRRTLTAGELMTAAGFDYRRQVGNGWAFLDSSAIAAFNTSYIDDVLVGGIPNWAVLRGGMGYLRGRGVCVPLFYVDGIRVRFSAFDYITSMAPEWIYGIEAYRGAYSFPIYFTGADAARGAGEECGLVALWTKSFALALSDSTREEIARQFTALNYMIRTAHISRDSRELLRDVRLASAQRDRLRPVEELLKDREKQIKEEADRLWVALPANRARTYTEAFRKIAELRGEYADSLRVILDSAQLAIFERNREELLAAREGRHFHDGQL